MDHKEFFQTFARLDFKTHVEGLTAFTVEELYQAIKARLVEELRAPEPPLFPYLAGKQKLIDSVSENIKAQQAILATEAQQGEQ